MIRDILLLAICAKVTLQIPTDSRLRTFDIVREILPKLCPTTNGRNGNNTFGEGHVTSQESCCTDCSFHPSCYLNHNCCFPRKSSSSTSGTSILNRKCLYPMTMQVFGSYRRYYQSYWMVDHVKSYNNVSDRSNYTAAKCGDIKVTPWGSFMPVSSKVTGKIYKNQECAKADNVTDGLIWDVLLMCKQSFTTIQTKDVSGYMSNLNLNSIPRYCRVHFSYPEEITYIKSELCYKDFVNTCKNREFTIPQNINLTKSQIRDACTSGLVSPYRAVDVHENVFCHICNGYRYSESEKCYFDKTGHRGFGQNLLSLIVDGLYLTETLRTQKETNPIACKAQRTSSNVQEYCRQVHCPSGQHLDEHGNCIFIIKKWYVDKCKVYLTLTAENVFDVEEIFTNNLFSLSRNWPREWTIISVSNRVLNTTNHRNLYIELINKLSENDLPTFLKNIKRYLKRRWILTLTNGTSLVMSAKLSTDVPFTRDVVGTLTREQSNNFQMNIPKFNYLYKLQSDYYTTPIFVITKLYYCEQIELDWFEYELSEQYVLYNNLSDRFMRNGEFTILASAQFTVNGAVEKARICLEDSGFIKLATDKVTSNCSSAKYVGYIFLVSVISLFMV